MQYRNLGRTGLKVSALCLGTMQFGWTADEAAAHEILSGAFERGVNFIDTADVYSRWVPGNPGGVSEQIIGRWLKEKAIPRDRLVIATKVRGVMGTGPNDQGLSRAHIMQAVEGSLRRLGTDYIDLYQAHWYDEDVPIDETLAAFDDLVRQGKVRYLGCSNYPAWRLVQSLWVSDRRGVARYDCLQPHYSLMHRAEFERELAQVCQEYGLGVIPYSPLARGFLTGKYQRGQPLPDSQRAQGVQRYFTEQGWALLDMLGQLGERKGGYSISQVALAWLLAYPWITSPIIGPRTIDQLEDNLGAVDFQLTNEERLQLAEASEWEQ